MTAVDGRHARSQKTRLRIITAAIALIEDGDPAPSARRIAERAEVWERTIFQHFPDLESLHAGVAEHHLAAALARYRPIDPRLAFDARLAAFTRQRGRVLERLTPLRRVALRYEAGSPALQASRGRWSGLARAELRRLFGGELAAAPSPKATLAAAQAVTSWAAWDELRTSGRLSVRTATDAMALALRRLLNQ